jgi:fatty acid desaturase
MLAISPTKLAADGPPIEFKPLVRQMSVRDNWRNWVFLGVDWAIIALAVGAHLIWTTPIVYLGTLVLIGSRMRALANLLHEAAHLKLFASRRLNNAAGAVLCAWPLMAMYRRYVRQHRLHHRNLWRNEQDPDAAFYRLTGTEGSSADRIPYATFLVRHVALVVVPVLPTWRLYRDLRTDIPRLVTVGAFLSVTTLAWLTVPRIGAAVFLYWLVPWLSTFQIFTYWAEIGEHGGLMAQGWSWGSRNWYGNHLTRWLIGSHSDDLYHLLHHWFPAVPHYRLGSLHAACGRRWMAYLAHDRCAGFFLGQRGRVSVLRDIWSGGQGGPDPCYRSSATLAGCDDHDALASSRDTTGRSLSPAGAYGTAVAGIE